MGSIGLNRMGEGARAPNLSIRTVFEGNMSMPTTESYPPVSSPQKSTLHVCTSCRRQGTPREPREQRPGFILYEALSAAVSQSALRDHVSVEPAECLSVCPRPCGIALSQRGKWSYLFGDQMPFETVDDIIECIELFHSRPKGFMARNERPKSLRGSILGRIPLTKQG